MSRRNVGDHLCSDFFSSASVEACCCITVVDDKVIISEGTDLAFAPS